MGVENNEVVIATTWNDDAVKKIHQWIKASIDPEWQSLFVFVDGLVNGKTTIFLAPDGSKKGWEMADEGRVIRNQFIKFITSFNYEDGSSPFDWVEVGYGEFGQKILRGNCTNCYSNADYEGEI